MAVWQVNQGMSFDREWKQQYLCCPDGRHGGHPLMRVLSVGDVLVHYAKPLVRGLSRVVALRTMPAGYSQVTPVCMRFTGPHLSWSTFTPEKKAAQAKYTHWQVAHVVICNELLDDPRVRAIPHHSFQGYLCDFHPLAVPAPLVTLVNAVPSN